MRFSFRTIVTLSGLLALTAPAFAVPKKPSLPVRQMSRPLFGPPVLVSEARKYMGTNPTDRTRLWCATFMNMVLAKAGYSGTNSDAAKSFAQYGHRISEPKIGAIAVLSRGKRGGHVGVVSGVDANGNPIIISGNHNKRVGEAIYARSRVIAYVMPAESPGTRTRFASGPASKPLDLGIDSPISELIAAIERESAEPVRLPPGANALARHIPESQLRAREAPRRKIELDPAIAEFLGIKPRAEPPRLASRVLLPPQVQQRPLPPAPPQRQLRVVQR